MTNKPTTQSATARTAGDGRSRSVLSRGHVRVLRGGVPPEDRALYVKMQSAGKARNAAVLEHRWVMTKHLGRLLHPWEVVTHLDGDRQNNALSNLQISVAGSKGAIDKAVAAAKRMPDPVTGFTRKQTTPLRLGPVVHPTVGLDVRPWPTGKSGKVLLSQLVTCPECGFARWNTVSKLRAWVAKATFTGFCRRCVRLHTSRPSLSAAITSRGYKRVNFGDVPKAERALFREALATSLLVSEHRWVMTKHLGRPLHPYELVDHMDGNKLNNSLDNLRIYLRGKQQPGSHNGYGTYYDEWQRAEAEVRRLTQPVVFKTQLCAASARCDGGAV